MIPLIVSASVLVLLLMALFMSSIAEWIDFKVYQWETERALRRKNRD